MSPGRIITYLCISVAPGRLSLALEGGAGLNAACGVMLLLALFPETLVMTARHPAMRRVLRAEEHGEGAAGAQGGNSMASGEVCIAGAVGGGSVAGGGVQGGGTCVTESVEGDSAAGGELQGCGMGVG
jgi:hypothetical protein